ncbi:MAG: heavy-metal-associated domain-containing protein [Saprospiraceae bacterium]|nr:heavy-metal-associated domain-containing protein [Saprospiraceae bacterium]
MRHLIFLFTLAFTISSCSDSGNQQTSVRIVKESDICRKTITIKGMVCVGCEVTVENKLMSMDGIVNVKASHKLDQVTVEFDSTQTDLTQIKNQIKEAGFKILLD